MLPELIVPAPPWMPIRNLGGEWVSEVHFLPGRWTFNDRALLAVQDSNLFSTASTALPLSLIDDSALPPERRFVSGMVRQAHLCAQRFRHGDGYRFWTLLPPEEGAVPRAGPLNIPVAIARATASVSLSETFSDFNAKSAGVPRGWLGRWFFWRFVDGAKSGYLLPRSWVESCLDPRLNPGGADALLNVPDDADDTALAAALWHTAAQRGVAVSPVDTAVLAQFGRHRDQQRAKEDGRDRWKGTGTGAYLTWLASETDATFGAPQRGVIPLGVNNVDAVINANVVYALALTGQRHQPGYADALRVVLRAAQLRAWPAAGLYYPQPMMFPYAATRAFRDGGAQEPPMRAAMSCLLTDLITTQEAYGRAHPARRGGFPGGGDRSEALATALGLTAMLNIGISVARSCGLECRYRRAVDESAEHLLALRRAGIAHDDATRRVTGARVYWWRAGVVFASSYEDLAQWRSTAHTTAVALDALARYAMAYDLTPELRPKLCLRLANAEAGTSRLDLVHRP
jgi:hypothetical protein